MPTPKKRVRTEKGWAIMKDDVTIAEIGAELAVYRRRKDAKGMAEWVGYPLVVRCTVSYKEEV